MSGVMATRTVAIAGADAYIIDAFVKPAAEKISVTLLFLAVKTLMSVI